MLATKRQMSDSQILSTLQAPLEAVPNSARAPALPLVFDACHTGVVLRALLAIHALVACAALYDANSLGHWLLLVALITVATLPACLLWLLLACLLKQRLHRLPTRGQYLAGAVLGVLAAAYGVATLQWSTLVPEPPWLAALVTGALVGVGLVAGLVWRARALSPSDARARLAELQARIRPHFLFNTLNSAIALVRADPAQAEQTLQDLSDLFRQALADPGEPVSLAAELALAAQYLAIEQLRFGPRLRVAWALDERANDARLPPLLLQPLIENAVKHGVEPSESGADIHISSERRGARVVVKIANTAPAGAGQGGQGLALANVRERLALLHDVDARFDAGWSQTGFQVRLELPA